MVHGDARFSWLLDNDLPKRCRHYLFLTCSYRDDPIFSPNVTSETCSKTYLKTGQVQACYVFEILSFKRSLI